MNPKAKKLFYAIEFYVAYCIKLVTLDSNSSNRNEIELAYDKASKHLRKVLDEAFKETETKS